MADSLSLRPSNSSSNFSVASNSGITMGVTNLPGMLNMPSVVIDQMVQNASATDEVSASVPTKTKKTMSTTTILLIVGFSALAIGLVVQYIIHKQRIDKLSREAIQLQYELDSKLTEDDVKLLLRSSATLNPTSSVDDGEIVYPPCEYVPRRSTEHTSDPDVELEEEGESYEQEPDFIQEEEEAELVEEEEPFVESAEHRYARAQWNAAQIFDDEDFVKNIEEAITEQEVPEEDITEEEVHEKSITEDDVPEEDIPEEDITDQPIIDEDDIIDQPIIDQPIIDEDDVAEEEVMDMPTQISTPLMAQFTMTPDIIQAIKGIPKSITVEPVVESVVVESVVEPVVESVLESVVVEPVVVEPVVVEPMVEFESVMQPIVAQVKVTTHPTPTYVTVPSSVVGSDIDFSLNLLDYPDDPTDYPVLISTKPAGKAAAGKDIRRSKRKKPTHLLKTSEQGTLSTILPS